MARTYHGYLIPDEIEPIDSYCITVQVPKNDRHVAAFFGAIEELATWHNWDRDTQHSGADVAQVWQAIVKQTKDNFEEGCMDCENVDDCLDASAIIATIEGDVVTNSADIGDNANDITDNETSITEIVTNPPDGNVYAPEPQLETDAGCGAAYYLVAKVRDFIVDAEGWEGTYADETETLEAIVGVLNFIWSPLYFLLAYLFDASPPASVLTDYDAQQTDMVEQLFCEGLDKSEFVTFVRTLTNGEAIGDFIDCIALSTWQSWQSIGQSDVSQDCSAFFCGEWMANLVPGGNNVTFGMGRTGMFYDGTGWHGNNANENDFVQLHVVIADQTYTQLRIEIEFTTNGNRQFNQSNGYEFQTTGKYLINNEFPAGVQTKTINSAAVGNYVIYCGDYATIHEVRVYGTGVNPFA